MPSPLPLAFLRPPRSPDLPYADEEWVTTSLLRYAPPVLINPVEPGTNPEYGYPGRGIDRKPLGLGFENISGPTTRDLLVAKPANGGGVGGGYPSTVVSKRIGRVQIEGWRRWRSMGGDLSVTGTGTGISLKPGVGSQSGFLEGVRADFIEGQETDAVGITGPATGIGPDIYIQNCQFRNVHGTFAAHDTGRSVSTASVISGVIKIMCSTTVPTTLTVGQEVIYGDSNNADFHSTWTIVSIGSGFVTANSTHGDALPTEGSSATGGTIFANDALTLGIHADIIQGYGSGKIKNLYVHKVTGKGNYDMFVVGQRIDTGLGIENNEWSMCDFEHVDIHPQDRAGFVFLLSDYDTTQTVTTRGARRTKVKAWEVYSQGGLRDSFSNHAIPQQGRFVDGQPCGLRIDHSRSYLRGHYAYNATATILGVFSDGRPATGDFAVWEELGDDYTSPGWVDVASSPPTPTNILLSGLSYNADDPRGTVIGIIDVVFFKGWIVDVTLIGTLDGKVQIVANELQRGPKAFDGGTFDITMRARIRGTATYFDKTFTITCYDAVDPTYASMSDPAAISFVRALYGYDLLTSDDLTFYDGFFAALRTIDSGNVWGKLKRFTTSAMLDERDSGINWFNPTVAEALAYNQAKSWTALQGFVGDPISQFHMTATSMDAVSEGLLQDSCAIMAGISIKAPLVADGTLPAGTEYAVGANNVTSDGYGGIYIGISPTGQISCKLAQGSTKNTTATPFASTGGTLRHVLLTRTASSGFVISYGPKGSAMTRDTGTAGTGASSVSVPLTFYDIWINGRNGASPNSGTRMVNYYLLARGLDSVTQADPLRAVIDTWLDRIGIA